MKSKGFGWLWIFAVPLLIGLAALSPGGGNLLLLLAMPFVKAGELLRQLSLMSAMGNRIALVLYCAVCASPLLLIRKSDPGRENLLLILASMVLFRVMWLLVNPDMMPVNMRNEVGKVIYTGAVYSVFVTWGIMKLMLRTDLTIQANVYKALQIFLLICSVCFLVEGLGFGLSRFAATLETLKTENTLLSESQLLPSVMFQAADFTFTLAENVLVAWILFLGARLVMELEEDPYSEACQNMSNGIFLWCRRTIRAVAAANLAMNLGQVLFAGELVNVNLTIRIPVLSLAVTFGMMALTRLLAKGRQIKEDNDLFI